jgi:histidine triad (HIT) family protein
MKDCIFCKVYKKELPSAKLFESKKSFAILDIGPVNKGHALVISKGHFKDFLETPEDVLNDMIHVVKKVAPAIKHAVKADGFNISTNVKKAAGQDIFHTHIHIVPRFNKDGLKLFPGHRTSIKDLTPFAKKIISLLK